MTSFCSCWQTECPHREWLVALTPESLVGELGLWPRRDLIPDEAFAGWSLDECTRVFLLAHFLGWNLQPEGDMWALYDARAE